MADWMEELERLAELRDKGLITDEEFEIKRQEIISSSSTEEHIGRPPGPNAERRPPSPNAERRPPSPNAERRPPSPNAERRPPSPKARKWIIIGIIILVMAGIGYFIGDSSSEPAKVPTRTVSSPMPDVICMGMEAAEEVLESVGISRFSTEDNNNKVRFPMPDEGWIVVRTDPRRYGAVGEKDVTLYVVSPDYYSQLSRYCE